MNGWMSFARSAWQKYVSSPMERFKKGELRNIFTSSSPTNVAVRAFRAVNSGLSSAVRTTLNLIRPSGPR